MNRIKFYLKALGMTQKRLAEKAGINDDTLRGYIYEQYSPNIYIAYSIADALGVPVQSVFPPGQGVIG